MYKLVEILGGVLCLGDCVFVEVFEDTRTHERYWQVSYEEPRLVTTHLVHEDLVPMDVRKLMHILERRGSHLEGTEYEGWILLGPHLARSDEGSNYLCLTFDTNPLGQFRSDLFDGADRSMDDIPWLANVLAFPNNRFYLRCFACASRWLQIVRDKKKRVIARMRMIEKELIETAWHPRRFIEWCLDHDEKQWLLAQKNSK